MPVKCKCYNIRLCKGVKYIGKTHQLLSRCESFIHTDVPDTYSIMRNGSRGMSGITTTVRKIRKNSLQGTPSRVLHRDLHFSGNQDKILTSGSLQRAIWCFLKSSITRLITCWFRKGKWIMLRLNQGNKQLAFIFY